MSRKTFPFLLLLFLWGIFLRGVFLREPLRVDESGTFIMFASKPWYEGISDYSLPNNHLFNTLLIHIFYRIFGLKSFVIRLPAFIFGIFILPLSFFLFSKLSGAEAGYLTLSFVSSSFFLTDFSSNGRGYTAITAFFLCLLVLSLKIKESPSRGNLLLFSIISSLGFFAIPVMLYPFSVSIFYLLFLLIKKGWGRKKIASSLLFVLFFTLLFTFLLYLPAILHTGIRKIVGNKYVKARPFPLFRAGFFIMFSNFVEVFKDMHSLFLCFILIYGIIYSLSKHWELLSALSIPFVIVFFQRVVPYSRIFIFLLPVIYGLASSGIVASLRIKNSLFYPLSFLLSILLGSIMLKNASPYNIKNSKIQKYALEGYEITEFLKGELMEGDRVFLFYSSPLKCYFRMEGLSLDYFSTDFENAGRIFVIIKHPGESLQEALYGKYLWGNVGSLPVLLKRFRYSTLYMMEGKK